MLWRVFGRLSRYAIAEGPATQQTCYTGNRSNTVRPVTSADRRAQNSRRFISLKKRLLASSGSAGFWDRVLSYWAERSCRGGETLPAVLRSNFAIFCSSRFDIQLPPLESPFRAHRRSGSTTRTSKNKRVPAGNGGRRPLPCA